jgi:transposase
VKRSLLTDGAGIPLSVVVAGANRNDFKLMAATLLNMPIHRPLPTPDAPQHLCLDKGYDYTEVYELAELLCYEAHVRPRGEERTMKHRGKKARRWVVERTHSWLNRFRRLLIRWEKYSENYLGLLHLACALITFHATLLG